MARLTYGAPKARAKKTTKPVKAYNPELRGQEMGVLLTPEHLCDLWYAHEEVHDPHSPLKKMLQVLRGAPVAPDDARLIAWEFERWAGEWHARRLAFFDANVDAYEKDAVDAPLARKVRQAGWVDEVLLRLTVRMVRGRFGFTDPNDPKPKVG